ncbi:MAG: hypothetical protein CMF96_12740 [Candidatus Marinimicrobia bacterium]|nr:hypothetical protein [Candidatus Neomarinimicrobiota bacterium]
MFSSTNKYIVLSIILILNSCVYFNTFYNAETYFKEGMKTIEESAIEDSEDIPNKAKIQLEKAINKCSIVIEKFPDSKYLDDAYYIIGKSGFYRNEFTRALKSFNTLINDFPESKFIDEAKIWHAYTQFKLGEIDSSKIKLEYLRNKQKESKINKYLIYTALADVSLELDSISKSFDYLDSAVENATEKSMRISAYNKIIKIAQNEKAYDRAIKYLLLLEKQSDSKVVRKNARLKWIEFNKKLRNYDIILQEIDIMLGTAEYEAMYLDLELEKAQILLEKGDLIAGRSVLISFIEKSLDKKDNKYKKTRAKSFFLLGKSSLFDEFDFSSARDYFDKMTEEYNRSENRSEVNKLLDMMDSFNVLKESYRKALKNYSKKAIEPLDEDFDLNFSIMKDTLKDDFQVTDSVLVDPKLVMDVFNPEKIEKSKSTSKSSKDKFISGSPDSLLMLIGEMLVYDFGRMDSAADRYETLISNYPESKFSPRAMYALTFYSEDSLEWKIKFSEKYPNPDFLIKKEIFLDENPFKKERMEVLKLADLNPTIARDSLGSLYKKNNDPDALYLSAYISDYILNDLEHSKLYYKIFVDSFPDNKLHKDAENRFKEIEQSILDTISSIIDSTRIEQIDYNIKIDTIKSNQINSNLITNYMDSINKIKNLEELNLQIDSNYQNIRLLNIPNND